MSEVLNYHVGKDLVSNYAEARPSYPNELIEKVMKYVRDRRQISEGDKLEKMLDVGCGSGQATRLYAPYFNSVLGFDISVDQVEFGRNTTSDPHVSYEVGNGSHFPAEDETVDFVNFGSSLHWMDIPAALSECHRVLKLGGSAAITTYYPSSIRIPQSTPLSDPTKDDEKWMKLHDEWMAIGHMHPVNKNCPDRYNTIYESIENPSKCRIDDVWHEKELSLIEFRKLFGSVAGYHTFMRENRPVSDPLDHFMETVKKFLKVENEADEDIRILVNHQFPTITFSKCRD